MSQCIGLKVLLSGVFICLAALVFHASPAMAFCSPPPSGQLKVPAAPGSYDKPRLPACLERSSSQECDRHELSAYDREREAYVRKLKRFTEEAQAFTQKAQNYARAAETYSACELRELRQR